ncbi:MAG: hypothetical protein DSM106950_05010 [Stigonema ocellatum SAG 48.90 = DSM 106950]|nr:hypothetical protein [Stigonema ocellatum SAG 48.90 = DSM 106950]
MLPKLDGISFCKQQRLVGDRTPIVLLTAFDLWTLLGDATQLYELLINLCINTPFGNA